jgi:hypothetical protein
MVMLVSSYKTTETKSSLGGNQIEDMNEATWSVQNH